MGFFDDVVNTVKNSGVPGYSQAAGLFSGITGVGRDPEAPPPPEYTPYQYNEAAFTPSAMFNHDTGILQRMASTNPGQANQAEYNTALQAQQSAALGQGPSVAEMQLQRGAAQNAAAIQSAAGSTRGAGTLALAQMNAANQMSQNNQALNMNQGLLRAQEMEKAREGLFAGISSGRQANTMGYQSQIGAYNQLGQREGVRLSSAQALDQARAREHQMAQGRAQENWSNQQAAAAQDDANDRQAGMNLNQGITQGIGMIAKK